MILEIKCPLTGTVGSNPTLSAINSIKSRLCGFCRKAFFVLEKRINAFKSFDCGGEKEANRAKVTSVFLPNDRLKQLFGILIIVMTGYKVYRFISG